MSSDLNRAVLIGRLVRDPELRYTNTGTAVARFSIANNKVYMQSGKKKERVSYFNCIAWGKLGETITQFCRKGHRIGFEGHLQYRSWEDPQGNKRSTVEIVVENLQFLEPKGDDEKKSIDAEVQDSDPVKSVQDAGIENDLFNDDDIPF